MELGLGFSSGFQMDETEVEEGEACYYRDNPSFDPDTALSYIVITYFSIIIFVFEIMIFFWIISRWMVKIIIKIIVQEVYKLLFSKLAYAVIFSCKIL